MKSVFSLLFLVGTYISVIAQTTANISVSKDAAVYFRSGTTAMDNNYGTHASLFVLTGTAGSSSTIWRSYVEIDLSSLPTNAVIKSATLHLQALSTLQNAGSNEVVLHKTTSSWDESTITWNNQPSYTTDVADPTVSSGGTGARDVDVTDWTRDALISTGSLSFAMKLVTEVAGQVRKMEMASSDHATTSYRPVLEVVYYENEFFMDAHPEPVNDIYELAINSINVQLDENFLSNTETISYEIKDRDNVVVVSKNSTNMTRDYLFIKIDPSSFSLTDDLIYEIIFYNDQGSKRYLKFKK